MNNSRSSNRWIFLPSLALVCLLAILPARAEVPLRAFTASYDLTNGNMHLATSELSLAPVDDHWRWRLSSRTRGVYAMLYTSKPVADTTFRVVDDEFRVLNILVAEDRGDGPEDKGFESAAVDWEQQRMEVWRKGKQREVPVSGEFFDYQSIHLVTANMQLREQAETRVGFYRKGKIRSAQVRFEGSKEIELNDESIEVREYSLTIDGSSTRTRYYYEAANPLVPVMVFTQKKDKSPTVLRLRAVEWQS